ncbi:MAG: TIGR01212 family radical SAM protein [Deltaproteobacteria bacterium]|nr:TIGR01212 family radical SAM protein [Deltaproteobacteria bacterium]
MGETLYRSFNSYLREVFGCRVQKVTIDAGLTCPNRDGRLGTGGCIYCNEKGSGTGAAARALSVSRQLEQGISFLARKYKAEKFIAYFQSFSNTYAPLERLRSLYAEALENPRVVGLSIGTRPDCVPDEILDHLADLAQDRLIWLEYGLQSSSEKTLALIRRGHGLQVFEDAVLRTRRRHLPVCVHVILGLPGEGLREMLNTARCLAGQDIQGIKLHLLYVVRGTVLHRWYESGRYRCLSRDEYAAAVGEFLSLLPPWVVIQRLTGDPHREELVAPAWSLEKEKNLQAIHDYLRTNNLYQGKHFPAPGGGFPPGSGGTTRIDTKASLG